MFQGLGRWSALGALLGQVAPVLLSQASSGPTPLVGPLVPLQPSLQYYPPGLSSWDPEVGAQSPCKARHCWTGNYIATFLIANVKPEDAQSILPNGMLTDPKAVHNGSYPVVLGFGTFENARSYRYSFLGLNYSEFLAAIPRVSVPGGQYKYKGPYLYPYRLYLNRLMPTIFGRLSGYPKFWERVTLTGAGDPPFDYAFKVATLLTGQPLLKLTFTASATVNKISHFPRFNDIRRLLIPNIIANGFFGIPVRTFFELDVANAMAWDLPAATLEVPDKNLFPVLPGKYTWKGIEQEPYGAVRVYLPWRLTSDDDPNIEIPWTVQTVGPGEAPPSSSPDLRAAS
ncbi:MAG TPA: hypothetical protein VLV49_02785 [Terriglobales bacterium]|nr:hypothetical protein [Terriglobales bacterium]